MIKRNSVVAMCALVVLAACGGSDKSTGPDTNDPVSAFTANISGGVNHSLSGLAAFAENGAEFAFGLALTDSTNGTITFGRDAGSALGPGSYQLGDLSTGEAPAPEDLLAVVFTGPPSHPEGIFVSKSGTLTISKRTATTLEGSFQFTATGFFMDAPEEQIDITVSGTYTALQGTVTPPALTIRRHPVPAGL